MFLFRRIAVTLSLAAGLGIICLSGSGLAQGPKKDAGKKDPVPASTVDWHAKKIAFEMRGQTWGKVFEWLADQTGMPYSSIYPPPPGTFTFINPKVDGKPREYTLTEVYDVINEILMAQTKHVLLRREVTLTMVPADLEIPEFLIPLVKVSDLKQRGKTEIVRVVITLKNQDAQIVAPHVKRLLGEFSHVSALPETNQLILRAPVSILLVALELFNPEIPPDLVNTYTHKCKYIRAAAAEVLLTKSLGTPQVIQFSRPAGDTGGPPADGPQPKGNPFGGGGQGGQQRQVRPHTVTSDKTTNTVVVNGPPDKIVQAKEVMAKFDVPRFKDDKGLLVGPMEIKRIDLPGGSAETMAKVLGDIYKDDAGIRILVVGPSRLLVNADPQTHWDIQLLIEKDLQPTQLKTVVFRLIRLEPAACEATLKGMIKDGPFIEADKDNNSIRVRGTPDQIKEVEGILKALDELPYLGAGEQRMINLEKGSGATVGEALAILLKRLRPGIDVQVINVGQLEKDIENKLLPKAQDKKPEQKKATQLTPDKVRELMYGVGNQPVSYQDEIKQQPQKKKGTITIQGFGNKILITSDDPKVLDEAQQLIRILVNTEAGPGDFEVLPLKTASATEVAKILDEAFNGPKGGQQGGGGRGGLNIPGLSIVSGLMGGGGGGGQSGRVENIRVVADAYTNALLIRAKPVDMLTIRRLIKNNLDIDNVNSEQVVKTYKIGLQYANATHVADNIRQLYAQHMQPRGQQQTTGGGPGGFIFGGARPVESTGAPNTVALSVSVDEDRNTLLVHCPNTLFKDIKQFVDEIENAASKQAYDIVPVKDIDPVLLGQLVEAMTGRSQMAKRPGDTSSAGAGVGVGAPGAFGTGGRGFGGGGFGTGLGGGNPGGFGGNPGGFGGNPGGFSGSPFGGGGPMFSGSGSPTFGGPAIGAPPGGGRTGGGVPGGGGGGRPPGGGKGGQQSRGPDFFVPPVMDDRSVNAQLEQQDRGRDFFVAPVMDDRAVSVFYDPAEEQDEPCPPPVNHPFVPPVYTGNPLSLAALMQDKEKSGPPDKMPDEKEGGFRPPPYSLKIDILPNGQLLMRGGSRKDIEDFLKTLKYLQEKSDGTRVEIRLVAVRFQDPNTLTQRLNEFYNRVAFDPNSTTIVAPGARPGGQGPAAPTPAPAAPAAGGQAQNVAAVAAPPPGNYVFLPQPRLGAILVAAPKARLEDVLKHIQMFDQPHSDVINIVPIRLKRASAKDVAQAITAFFQSRFPGPENPVNFNNVRVTPDTVTNTLMVQASPADLADIKRFIEHVDNDDNLAPKNELRVVFLRNAVALDLGNLLYQAIANGTLTVTPTSGAFQPAITSVGAGGATTIGGTVIPTIPMTKDSRLRFVSGFKGGVPLEAGILEDIRFQSDVRTNSLIVIAPEKTMPLLLALIRELDVPPIALSKITVFQLKRSDAIQFALMLQQLFLGTGQVGTKTGAAGGGGGGGGGAAGAAGANRPLTFTISGVSPEGAPIIDLRVTVDERTNSLIVAGSQNDILTVGALIAKIEDADMPRRRNDTVKLRNANAVDVVNAVQTFYTAVSGLYKTYNQETNFLGLYRDVVLQAEPISNSVMVSATPELFEEVMLNIAKMDTTPPMVVVSCLIAEVDLTGTEEFGVELGLQNPLAFLRGLIPGTTTAVTYTTTAGGSPTGFSPTGTITASQPIGVPGFAFLDPNTPLGNNTSVSPNAMAAQALSSLGVGRTSSNANFAGFVFSSGNQSVSILIRALKAQERIHILTRPQIMTLDNQAAVVQLVTYFPIVSGASTVTTGVVTAPPIVHTPLGVTLQVTPRITPDGRVLMRVIPEVSAIQSTTFPLGNGTVGTSYNVQHLETSVSAYDGDTILIGGLIQKKDDKVENKVPVMGDLPYVGWMWRFRTDVRSKTELVFIMTPHIVRNRMEAQQIMLEETRKIDWVQKDVMRVHGTQNCEAFMPMDVPQMPFGTPQSQGTPNLIPANNMVPPMAPLPPQTQSFTPPAQTSFQPAPQGVQAASAAQSQYIKGGLLQNLFGSKETAPADRVQPAPIMSADGPSLVMPAQQPGPPAGPTNYIMPSQSYYPPR